MVLRVAGIDCGAKATKAAVLVDSQVAGTGVAASGLDVDAAAQDALRVALDAAGLDRAILTGIVATGAGRSAVSWVHLHVSEVTADARGAVYLNPAARTILDIGAEEARAIRCDPAGRALDFALNEKCAAGTGAFLEAMARTLNVSLYQLNALSLESSGTVTMNAQCAVFAESEVVSLLHANTPLPEIAHAIFGAIASRAVSLVRRVGIAPALVLAGGLAGSPGFVSALRAALADESDLAPLDSAGFVGAIGAALEFRSRSVETGVLRGEGGPVH